MTAFGKVLQSCFPVLFQGCHFAQSEGGRGVEKFALRKSRTDYLKRKIFANGENLKANVLATFFDPMSDFSLKAFVDDGVFSANICPDVFRVKD